MECPKTFWCVGCECDHLFKTMKEGLCPQCHEIFNEKDKTQKELWTIRLCFFGLVLITVAIITAIVAVAFYGVME